LNHRLCNNLEEANMTLQEQIFSRIQSLEEIADAELELVEFTARTCAELEFSELRDLSPAVALALSKHRGDLSFSKLRDLTPAVAQTLSKHEGDLTFSGLRDLSPAVALAFSGFEWNLSLDGLTALSEASSKALARYPGFLSLKGITSPSDVDREFFSEGCRSTGIIWGFDSLTEDEFHLVRDSPARVGGPFVVKRLASLAELSSCARDLELVRNASLHSGQIVLPLLTYLPVEAARLLSAHPGRLCLDGITSLQPETAEALASHRGWALSLNGLRSISDSVACALSRYPGDLHLDGVASLGPAAAQALSRHSCDQVSPGDLSMNALAAVSDETALALSGHRGELSLRNLSCNVDAPGHCALKAKLGL
jgi:hypothetical protein